MLLEGKRIFVVEDNLENRVVYQLIFMRERTSVSFERYGPTAIARLKAFGEVDLIILDLMLTRGTTGFTLFDAIRKLPEYDRVPIVAVSSADPGEAIYATRKQGFSGYIAKPIDQERFPGQLRRIIDGEAIWDEG